MKKHICFFLVALISLSCFAQYVQTTQDTNGWRLTIDGKPIEVRGVVWAYTPIGETHTYDLFSKPDDFIMQVIDTDMPLLKNMGVNTIRCFSTIPPKWVEYIYTKYGIYTMINDLLGRYGVTVNGKWNAQTDYSDLYTRKVLVEQAKKTASMYRTTPGVLMYMFGNESNYGLVWSGSNIENLPTGEQNSVKAGYLYSLLEEAMVACKDIDPLRPVGIINGDVQYLELIKELCPSLDILGVNAYRGYKFYDSFYANIKDELGKPVVFTEAGADAYNALLKQEDQYAQMTYLQNQWEEVYQNSYGKGGAGNILGGYVFEWIDEWWKHYQNKNLLVHDTVGTWANAGYDIDYRMGIDNMNEEWFGLCAQSEQKDNGVNKRIPRAAYYLMQDIWTLSLYDSTRAEVTKKFATLKTDTYLARGNEQGIKETLNNQRLVSVDYLDTTVRATTALDIDELKNYSDNGNWKDAIDFKPSAEATLGISANPAEGLFAHTALRVWTDSPYTRIGDTWANYYTHNPKDIDANGDNTTLQYADVYSASFNYNNDLFALDGYYHVGHGSYEETGDIFNISREAYDVITCDIDGSKAPIAVEFRGKDLLDGLSVIAGPEIWEDAKPQIIANYWKRFPSSSMYLPSFAIGAVYAEELGTSQNVNIAPYNAFGSGRKVSLFGEATYAPWVTVKAAALHAGSEKWGASYLTTNGNSATIGWADTLGGYLQIGTNAIRYSYIYINAIYRGLVADTNAGAVRGGFFTSDSGAGNRFEIQTGVNFDYGYFSFKPVARARVPLEKAAGRSLLSGSPFIVGLGNRQVIEFEATLTYDSEGATWFHEWNSNDIEGSPFAASLSGLYTLYAGETDVIPFKSDTWDTTYSDGDYLWYNGIALPEQRNLWQVGARFITNPLAGLRVIGTFDCGSLGSTGNSDTIIKFWKASIGARYNQWMVKASYLSNCWGPENWWRIFNFTFPAQWTADVSYGFGTPIFAENTNRIGIKVMGRTFNENSSDAYGIWSAGTDVNGKSYMEITTYVNIRY